jgi:hypothetical protein
VDITLFFREVAHVCEHRMAVREAGFTDEALKYPRSERGFIALCAWNGVEPEQAPLGWRYAPNKGTLVAWERVVAAILNTVY